YPRASVRPRPRRTRSRTARARRPRRSARAARGSVRSDPRAGRGPFHPRPGLRARRSPARAAWVEFESWSCRFPCSGTELDVIDVVGDRRVLAADRALRVAAKLDLVELGRERVEEQ